MTERQKKLIDILDEIGETQPKRKSKKTVAEGGLSDGIDKVENLLVQEGLLEIEPVGKLTKEEAGKLMDACLQMRADKVETLNTSISKNVFFVSILSFIVSVAVTTQTLLKTVSSIIVVVFTGLAVVAIVEGVIVLFYAMRTARENAQKADRYRNAYILLRFLQEEGAEEEKETV